MNIYPARRARFRPMSDDRIPTPPRSDPDPRPPHQMRRPQRRRQAVITAASVAAVIVAIVATFTYPGRSPGRGTTASPTAASPGEAPHGLTDRLELAKTTYVAGTTIAGTLVINNRTGKVVDLNGHRCGFTYAVGITNNGHPFKPVFTTMCVVKPFPVNPGTTRLPVSILTTSTTCSPCPTEGLPVLPPGTYKTELVQPSGLPIPQPATVIVTLIAKH